LKPYRAAVGDGSTIVTTVRADGAWVVKLDHTSVDPYGALVLTPGAALHLCAVLADAAGHAAAANRLAAVMQNPDG
jgi:hypothetical protein